MANNIIAEYINPIRFRELRDQEDMPELDLMVNRTQYYNGIKPLEYYPDWKLDERLIIQLKVDSSYTIVTRIQTPSGLAIMTKSDITPAGYDPAYKIWEFRYTLNEVGEYYMYTETLAALPSGQYQLVSDTFYARENEQDLVELKYSDSRNRYGGVFYDSTTQIWEGKTYFTGQYFEGEGTNEQTIYTDDLGSPTKLTSEPQDTVTIALTDVPRRYVKQLNRILSCDTIYINNQRIEVTENFSIDPISRTEGVNIEITATLKYE